MLDMTALPPRATLPKDPMGMLQTLRAARRNLLHIIPEDMLHKPIMSGHMGVPWHMITDPEALAQILVRRVEDYPKSDVTKNILRPAIGDSLFIAEGAHWRWQRRAAAPAFSSRNTTALGPLMSAAADRLAQRLEAKSGRAADFQTEMMAATFEVISDVTFAAGSGFDRSAVHDAIETFIDRNVRLSVVDVLGLPSWVPRPGAFASRKASAEMRQLADRAIADHHARADRSQTTLADLLSGAADPKSGRTMTPDELRDNLLTFIVAGHETTALTLAWACYLCAFDPATQERVRAEATSVLDGRIATAQDVPKLTFTRQVVQETLRLYPPAAIVSRTAKEPDLLCGTQVNPGDTVTIPIYALHRSRLLWEDPDQFRPDRFSDPSAIDRFAYIPFADGPRICIGASFALQEAVIILATLLSKLRLAPIRGRVPDPVMLLTLRPHGGVWLGIERI